MIEVNKSPTLTRYKNTMKNVISLYYPTASPNDIDKAINYSINKRIKNANAKLSNSYKRYKTIDKDPNTGQEKLVYKNLEQEITLLEISDYIASKKPIVTAFGTMFANHNSGIPNPLNKVIQSFLDLRSQYKKQMFQYPKGSADFEKYNLLQQLSKIDANGCYGCLGQYTALIYNNAVATSITSQGRACVSTMILHFEMFLNNNVKFGSLNETLEFINNIVNENKFRKFKDDIILDHIPSVEECFAKVVLGSGYRWIPNEKELDIIWKVLINLTQEDITRIYYKNNLFEFVSNKYVIELVKKMIKDLETPFFTSSKVPPEIADDLNHFKELCMEYVYYRYMVIDRIDRADNAIKSVVMVSDTDSTIISVDGWYRFIVEQLSGMKLKIANDFENPSCDIDELNEDLEDKNESKEEIDYEYDFRTDEVYETHRLSHPEISTGDNNVRYSIISILSYVLDHTVNDYMIKMCEKFNSVDNISHYQQDCKIYSKTEFLFARLMMVPHAKKNYASIIEIQEGNMVPKDKQLDTKGIEAIHKSSKPLSTRKALKKILLEDILRTPVPDQLKFIKDIAVLEHNIVESVKQGSKEYYKPATVKSMNTYDDPLRIQGVKASIAWNMIRPNDLEAINLEERNAVNIAKVNINRGNAEDIKEKYPEIYENIIKALDDDTFKTYTKEKLNEDGSIKIPKKLTANEITAVAIPLDVEVPKWLMEFIDYDSIIIDNLAGFPYESIGIQRMNRSGVAYTNIVQL